MKPAKDPEMNGVHFNQYKDFVAKWRLVTVRYRMDSKEMRFTYANEKAWQALRSFKPNYPDGAVFAKVGLQSEVDPAFPSSVVPSGTKRYQFMLKDSKKYRETDGWGYALFTDQGQLFAEDAKAKTAACAACHRIVPERDFVFSRPVRLGFLSQFPDIQHVDKKIVQFAVQESKFLPEDLKGQIQRDFEAVQGRLKISAFSGTLDEIVPLLIERSRQTGGPTALIVDDKNYSFAIPTAVTQNCPPQKGFHIVVQFNGKKVRDAQVCNL